MTPATFLLYLLRQFFGKKVEKKFQTNDTLNSNIQNFTNKNEFVKNLFNFGEKYSRKEAQNSTIVSNERSINFKQTELKTIENTQVVQYPKHENDKQPEIQSIPEESKKTSDAENRKKSNTILFSEVTVFQSESDRKKLLEKFLLDISLICQKYGVLFENSDTTLKNMQTKIPKEISLSDINSHLISNTGSSQDNLADETFALIELPEVKPDKENSIDLKTYTSEKLTGNLSLDSGISRKNSKKETRADDEIYRKLHEMKKLFNDYQKEKEHTPYIGYQGSYKCQAEIFFRQAQFMKNVTDNFKGHENLYYNNGAYNMLSNNQLRVYFTWRTNVRKGIIKKTNYYYVEIYFNELINKISDLDDTAILKHLIDFWNKYRVVASIEDIEPNIKIWVRDFYILNHIDIPFEEINTMLPKAFRFKSEPIEKPDRESYIKSLPLLATASDYDFLNSKFYLSGNDKLVLGCIDFVFKDMEKYFKEYDVNFFDVVFASNKKVSMEWKPFPGGLYHQPEINETINVEFSSGEKFEFDNGEGYMQYSVPCSNPFNTGLGYLIKLIENELRILTGFKSKLKPDTGKIRDDIWGYHNSPINHEVILMYFITEKFESRVKKAVNTYYKSYIELSYQPSFLTDISDSKTISAAKSFKIPYSAVKTVHTLSKAELETRDKINSMRKMSVEVFTDYNVGAYDRFNSYLDSSQAKKAYIFCLQAESIKNVTDNYNKVSEVTYSGGVYEHLNNAQLRTYLAWRTKVRNGIITETNREYVIIYINELINKITVPKLDDLSLLKYIIWFYNQYKKLDVIDSYYNRPFSDKKLAEWIRDFYIINDINIPFEEVNELLPQKIRFSSVQLTKPDPSSYTKSAVSLNKISDYKFFESKFYKSEYGYLLLDAIDFVFKKIKTYLEKFNINWFREIYSSCNYQKLEWIPFSGAVYFINKDINDIEYEFINGEKYLIKNGLGYVYKYVFDYNPNNGAIGYSIKLIESELRQLIGFKYKLKPDPKNVTKDWMLCNNEFSKQRKHLEHFTTEDFSEMVKNSVNEFFLSTGIEPMIMAKKRKQAKKTDHTVPVKPPVIEIDRSALDAIRESAKKIQSALIIDEETDEHSVSVNKPANEVSKIENIKNENKIQAIDNVANRDIENIYEAFVLSLSELELSVLKLIIYSDNDLNKQLTQLALKNNDLPEVIIEKINEKALEYISDNIIEISDSPYIYDEYAEELKKEIKEE